jgi:hypothetical protein
MWRDVFDRNPYGTNCWLLAADASDEAVVVDPGFEPEAVHAVLEAAGRRPSSTRRTPWRSPTRSPGAPGSTTRSTR